MNERVNLRELILEILLSVTRDGNYCHIVLSQMLQKFQYLSKQERSFITKVAEGTLENLILIDYMINQVSSVKVNKMKPVICTIIRSGVYQLRFMDAVPASAACNEAVKLAEKKGFYNLKGFVNGVLRAFCRNEDPIRLPDKNSNPYAYLSVRYSMPQWILKQWQDSYDLTQIEAMLQAFLSQMPTSVRVNTQKITRAALTTALQTAGIVVKQNEDLPEGLLLSNYDYLDKIPEFRQGLFYVQDESSMRLAHLAAVKEGDYVIDVCAAPGGKSLHLAQLLNGSGMVEARDLTPTKIALIEENINRSGLKNIRATCMDARIRSVDEDESADVVIADLPCSGLGIIGRKSDIKYKMTLEKQTALVALQREILHNAQFLVKPCGTLLYSTCTINREENENNVTWFLQEHPIYQLEWQQQILPLREKNDGFFLAKFNKIGNLHGSQINE
jgi:16S rRNA (cytosine967-C5)-methyltransferase